MKKIILSLIFISCVFAQVNIKNIVGEKVYNQYKGLINTIEKENNTSNLTQIITVLKENGLIELFFNKPKIIHPKFVFINNNPEFNTMTLYNTLKNLGYYYFYPSEIKNDSNYSITIEMQSTHHIDPVSFINEINTYGCNVTNLIKENDNYKYIIDCSNEHLNAPAITDQTKAYLKVNGTYWFDTNGFKQILITTSKFDRWHPYIAVYDKNLNLIEVIALNNIQKSVKLNLTKDTKYIKIRDNFTKENIKRGIFIKGIQ
ncbi:hypothetical protein [Caminibacter sp.]